MLSLDGALLRADPPSLARMLEAGQVHFHRGSIRGALPAIVE